MGNHKDTVTSRQVTIAVFSLVIGAGILTVSREVVDTVQTPDAWISVLLAGLLTMIAGAMSVILCNRYPGRTIFQFSKEVVGPVIGTVANTIAILYFIFIAGFETRILSEIVSTYLLHRTPEKVLMITFIWVATYQAIGGINPILKAFEIYFPIVIVLLVGILLLSMRKFEIINILPFFGNGITPLLKGVGSSLTIYAGYEIIFVTTAWMEKPKDAMKSLFKGLILTTVINTAVVLITIGVMSIDEIKNLAWPTSSLVAEIYLPGGFIENYKLFFIIIWMISIYTTFLGVQYLAAVGISQTFPVKYRNALFAILPFIYLVALVPHDLGEVFIMGSAVGYTWLGIGLVVPMLFLVISLIRGNKKGGRAKQK